MKSIGLLASNSPRFWPQWGGYFFGDALFKLLGWRIFKERQLCYRNFKISVDVEGNNGLAFLYEVAVAKGYSFCNDAEISGAGVLLDVGANCGFFALIHCADNSKLSAYCFEPHPVTFNRLKKNVEINALGGRIFTIQAAIGAESGQCSLAISPTSSMGMVSTSTFVLQGAESSVTVPLLRLDDFAIKEGVVPTFLKVDMEGFEVEVLKGAANCLKSTKVVLVECHSNELLAECQKMLQEAGFELATHGTLIAGRRRKCQC